MNDVHDVQFAIQKPTENAQMNEWIEEVRGYFRNMTLGEISMSPYDTAWVARVPALDGSNGPQFPLSLQWIVDHQLSDGDWGEPSIFLGFDRVCNTLACIIALQTWGVGAENVERGTFFSCFFTISMDITEKMESLPKIESSFLSAWLQQFLFQFLKI